MKASNYFLALLIGYNRAASSFAPKIPALVAITSLIIYHLQRAGTFVFSTQETASFGTTVNRAITQVIKLFQFQYWTEITPLNYEGITIILFSIIVIGISVKLRFILMIRTRERLSSHFQLVCIAWALVFDKYFFYIPVLENSFYVFSQPVVKAYILTFAIFNLTCMLIFRILQCVFLFWNPYTNLKCIPRGITGELIDIIGFLIMYATKNAGSNISIYMGLALTALQFVCLFLAPKFVDGLQNQVELVFQVFCFALGIDILLQYHVYHAKDFPFLLMGAFIYWGLRSLLRYRSWSLLSQFEDPHLSNAMMKSLPRIFDEYFWKSSFLDSIYPIIAYRSNLRNEKISEDMMIFSKEDYSLEDNPHKQKTLQAFITFIESVYQKYIQATDITKNFLQPIMVSYLFFVKRVLKDHRKTLVLLNDFRIKLKRGQIPMKFREEIQMILIEQECLQEAATLKGNFSLNVAKVFSVFDKTEDMRLRIIKIIEKKLEFLESLKEPCLNLNQIKSSGIILTKKIRSLLKEATEDSDFTHSSQLKELFAFFVKEVLQSPKILGFEFKKRHSNRLFTNEGNTEITAYELIEKIQAHSGSQTFILVVNDCTVNRGKIMRCTKQLLTRLNYLTEEASGLNFDEIVVAVNYQNHRFVDEKLEINQDSDRKMCQVILKSRTGDLIPAHGRIQQQVFDDIPCMVLLGEEEDKHSLDYFILCQQDGQIQGISAKLASTFMISNKLNGKFIQQILSPKNSESSSLFDDAYTRKTGALKLQTSKLLNEGSFEIDFSVCPFGTKDTDSGICKNYVVYLYPASAGSLRDALKSPTRKLVFSTNQVMSPRSIEGYQSDRSPFATSPNSFADKIGKFQFASGTEDEKTRLNSNLYLEKLGSQSSLKPQLYSSKILEVKIEEESELWAKSSNRKIEEANDFNDFVSEEFEEKKSGRLAVWTRQNPSTAHYGSVQGSSKRQRNTERARQLIENHKLPVSIEWMRVLQVLACIALFAYLMIDYFDLTRKFEILSQMSGITTFPLTLLTIMGAFLGYSEVSLAAAAGLFDNDIRMHILYLVSGMTSNLFNTFQTQFEASVLQSNPRTYYSDFTYENYALNLTLPDSPYLNREVKFNEALNTLRGYMSDFIFGFVNAFQVDIDSLNFFRQENLNYHKIFQLLSDDLFSRLSAEFDGLLMLLGVRIIVGIAVAITIGVAVLYTLIKLYLSSENLLSKFARIPDSELDNEIASHRQKVAYLHGRIEEIVEKKKLGVYSSSKKSGRSGATMSKKYKRLNQYRVLHIFISIAYCALFLAPFLIAYALKKNPVHSCVPLIKQYKLLAESGAAASAISGHLVEAMLLAGSGEANEAVELINATESFLDRAKEFSSSLYSMLNTIDSLQDDPYVSENLIIALQKLRNETFCDSVSDPLVSFYCRDLVPVSTNVLYGIPAMFKGSIEGFSVYRKLLRDSPTLATVAKLTSNLDAVYEMFFTTITHVALGDVITIYQSTFEEVAVRVNRVFTTLLVVSILYYCLLILLLLAPLLPWAKKEYKKVRDIYTLLPTDVLMSNPYILTVLKSR